jgi:hypothetical protein
MLNYREVDINKLNGEKWGFNRFSLVKNGEPNMGYNEAHWEKWDNMISTN